MFSETKKMFSKKQLEVWMDGLMDSVFNESGDR